MGLMKHAAFTHQQVKNLFYEQPYSISQLVEAILHNQYDFNPDETSKIKNYQKEHKKLGKVDTKVVFIVNSLNMNKN